MEAWDKTRRTAACGGTVPELMEAAPARRDDSGKKSSDVLGSVANLSPINRGQSFPPLGARAGGYLLGTPTVFFAVKIFLVKAPAV
jgi:hypothetical protein